MNAGLMGKLGEKPKVPEYVPVSVQDAQSKALNANLANWKSIRGLATTANDYTVDQLLKNLEKMSPGVGELRQQQSNLIGSLMKGEIPEDVASEVLRRSNAASVAGGFGGSTLQGRLTARNLGLTSLDIMGRGMSANERWQSLMGQMTPQYNVSSMFVNPAMSLAVDQFNTSSKWNRDWLANQISAMPSPMDKAWTGMFESIGEMGDVAASYGMGGGFSAMAKGGGGNVDAMARTWESDPRWGNPW